MSIKQVKQSIRQARGASEPATKKDVKDRLAESDRPKAALQAYESAKRLGEIYEYPDGELAVVKITDEQI